MELGLTDLPVPVVQGEGCVSRIGAMAAGLGGTRAMLISGMIPYPWINVR